MARKLAVSAQLQVHKKCLKNDEFCLLIFLGKSPNFPKPKLWPKSRGANRS